jgi:NAD(P)-dependent dehydrogenase (short-subunit alcohol dehydrogenase family)
MRLFDDLDLDGRVAIVTGASRGIGLSTARCLGAYGVRLAVVDIDGDELARQFASGRNISLLVCDLSLVEAAHSVVASTLAAFGRIDILINVAGIVERTTLQDVTEESWQRLIDTNLKSQFFLSQACLPHMRDQRWGRIINFSSIAGQMGGRVGTAAYSVTKGGTLALTKSLALEAADCGVTVNSISPAVVMTRMITDTLTDRQLAELIESVPTRKATQPEEVAAFVALLCSRWGASITGHTLDMNGGVLMR